MTSFRSVAAWLCLAGFVSLGVAAPPSQEEADAGFKALKWQRGPVSGALTDKATIKLPDGMAYLDESNSSKFLELTGNVPAPHHNIIASEDWFAAFTFDPVGYVKDDEKIDADALLKQLKESDEPSNEERRKRGLPELHTEGCYVAPHYDTQTKHLEWGLRLRSGDSTRPVINYTVRLLGRTGYESAILVSSPDKLDADVRAFKAVLTGFDFNAGERYAEFKPGDRVAEFGLAALVAGGAAAVAVKTGFWKVLLGTLAAFWKVIAVGAVGLVAAIGKLFGGRSRQ